VRLYALTDLCDHRQGAPISQPPAVNGSQITRRDCASVVTGDPGDPAQDVADTVQYPAEPGDLYDLQPVPSHPWIQAAPHTTSGAATFNDPKATYASHMTAADIYQRLPHISDRKK